MWFIIRFYLWFFFSKTILKFEQFIKKKKKKKKKKKNINWSYLLNSLEYFDNIVHTQWYWQDLAQVIAKWHSSSVEAMTRSKFWKRKNSPISWLSGIVWWNFAYTLILSRSSPMDCQMLFVIGRGYADVQILKKKWNWLHLLNIFWIA